MNMLEYTSQGWIVMFMALKPGIANILNPAYLTCRKRKAWAGYPCLESGNNCIKV